MAEPPTDRFRTLLLRADNTLENHVPGGDESLEAAGDGPAAS